MEALLGFSLDFWDYATFLSLSFLVAVGLGIVVFMLGLPGRIAIARNHPEAEAVYLRELFQRRPRIVENGSACGPLQADEAKQLS